MSGQLCETPLYLDCTRGSLGGIFRLKQCQKPPEGKIHLKKTSGNQNVLPTIGFFFSKKKKYVVLKVILGQLVKQKCPVLQRLVALNEGGCLSTTAAVQGTDSELATQGIPLYAMSPSGKHQPDRPCREQG